MAFINIKEQVYTNTKENLSSQPYYRIIYLLSDGYTYIANKMKKDLEKGCFIMIPCDQSFFIPENIKYLEIEFDYSYISMINKSIIDNCFFSHYIAPCKSDKILLDSLLNTITEEYNKYIRQDNILIKLLICEMIVRLSRIAILEQGSRDSYSNEFKGTIADVVEYVNKYYTSCTLNSVCEKFYLSKSYLCRSFKKHTGIGFTSYINNKRVELAANLLINTDKSIDDISQLCGYTSGNYFGTCFKSIMKVSPLKYRGMYT